MQVTMFCPLNVAGEHVERPSSYSGYLEIDFPREVRRISTLSRAAFPETVS
jgi:hypothetical protein